MFYNCTNTNTSVFINISLSLSLSLCFRPTDDTDSSLNPKLARRMKRAEQARLEALQSFGGCGLDVVLDRAKKKVARTLDGRKRQDEEVVEEEAEKENSVQ